MVGPLEPPKDVVRRPFFVVSLAKTKPPGSTGGNKKLQ